MAQDLKLLEPVLALGKLQHYVKFLEYRQDMAKGADILGCGITKERTVIHKYRTMPHGG
jgi:hypothetical protein